MKTTTDCIPCFISHSLNVAKMTSGNPDHHLEIVRKTLSMVADMDFDQTPPAMAKKIHSLIRRITGVEDSYLRIKDESTAFTLEMLPFLRHEVEKSDRPFETTIRLVIAGNIIDFGTNHDFRLDSVHQIIADSLKQQIDLNAIELLKRKMDQAANILYIGDNCGEIVFDRLLIEPYKDKITLAVRGRPILNDVTRREAAMSGLDNIVDIIDTGDAVPGVVLPDSSDEFRKYFRNAELIISKGQGNFETMHDTDRPVFFLFKAKCTVIAQMLDSDIGSLHVIGKNIKP
ncbi:MAG: ARMT1-like domain-containing protein [Victivallales bacterium]